MAQITVSITITSTMNAGPARGMVGYFAGTPVTGLPIIRIPAPVLRAISARCNVTPNFIPITKWYTVPAVQYSLSATSTRR